MKKIKLHNKLSIGNFFSRWKDSKLKLLLTKKLKKIKKAYRHIKYLDKTKLNYFIVTSFIGLFCTFTMTTYSAFNFSKVLNAAVITVGKLNYTLTSSSNNFSNGNVSIGAGETLTLDLNLASSNSISSKYALIYSTESSDIEVYYSQSIGDNMNGIIGASGSNIDMQIVIINNGSNNATVSLTVAGGYEYNDLELSNITTGYYEADIILRAHQLDENLENDTRVNVFPAKNTNYRFLRAVCDRPAKPRWDNENWNLILDDVEGQISCDVYFKEVTNDIEVYYFYSDTLQSPVFNTGTEPDNYTQSYYYSVCTSGTGSYNVNTHKFTTSNIEPKTLCSVYFTHSS